MQAMFAAACGRPRLQPLHQHAGINALASMQRQPLHQHAGISALASMQRQPLHLCTALASMRRQLFGKQFVEEYNTGHCL
eukprot:1140715-Pelagomonas_calceolata.AAC.7